MKRVYLFLCLAVVGIAATAQNPSIQWGDDFRLRKGSTDLKVIFADNTGAYLQESHLVMKSYYVVGASLKESGTLVKVDNNLAEIYRNDFNKELKGKEFEQLFAFRDKLFLFASDYRKKDKALTIFASTVDKNSGELNGEWKEVTTFQLNERNDDVDFKLDYNVDSTKMLIVSSIEGKEKNEYQILELDEQLKSTTKPLSIQNEFERKKYQLEDVLYTSNRNVILVGRIYEYEEGKKKKDKFLDFTNYNIRIYDEKGKQKAEINTGINGKWLTNTKIVQEKNKDLILAAFYSNAKKGKTIDGLLVQRINSSDGKVVSTSDKKINNSLLSGDQDNDDNDDDKDESKEDRKKREELKKLQEEGEGFSKYMQFRKIFYTADNGLVIIAERYDHYITSTQSYTEGHNNMPGQWRTTTYSVFLSGDLMMCKIDASGNIGWLQIVPKKQREEMPGATASSIVSPSLSTGAYYFQNLGRPYYSGFAALQTKGNIQMLFNDNPKNIAVTQAGQKAKSIHTFTKSDCFLVNIDELSGKVTRKVFFSNTEIPTAMPRLGAIVGNDMYLVGKAIKAFSKSRVAVGKITIK
ncbi:MAG: hypothetical protein J7623_11465 [Chitinophaga sp.]|uniref:hypothetical protein n=1 Tax=Chitinophaga sp. TaxID=1869181 RepID=UPI001B291598|nr:hypothetical protein [Chitinophaga sp.]MBO9729245.1 hypothetical protein [Chitinophaga sp.]